MKSTYDFNSVSSEEINAYIAQAHAMRNKAVAKTFKSITRSIKSYFAELALPYSSFANK